MTHPDTNGGHHLFAFSPKELILYMTEMLGRLERVGDRLQAYTDTSERKITLLTEDTKVNSEDSI